MIIPRNDKLECLRRRCCSSCCWCSCSCHCYS